MWNTNVVICRDMTFNIQCSSPNFLGLIQRYIINENIIVFLFLLTKYSVTSPNFLFCFQSLPGKILKCLKTSTKGCYHKVEFSCSALSFIFFLYCSIAALLSVCGPDTALLWLPPIDLATASAGCLALLYCESILLSQIFK